MRRLRHWIGRWRRWCLRRRLLAIRPTMRPLRRDFLLVQQVEAAGLSRPWGGFDRHAVRALCLAAGVDPDEIVHPVDCWCDDCEPLVGDF